MDISIIICTYNPEQRIFSRCLNAVKALHRKNLQVQTIVVDNNSTLDLEQQNYVAEFLAAVPGSHCIRETRPGLTYARIAGFAQSVAPIVIYFDDDNEPAEDYLVNAYAVLDQKAEIGLVGPGEVRVDFIDGSNEWLESERALFQEMNQLAPKYNNVLDAYQECYPFGTGLVLRRDIMQKYCSLLAAQGEISDRIGNSLVGGGDVQIVWTGIKMGYYAGRTPAMQLVHIIPQSRTTDAYIKKLSYSLGYSETKCRLGVFPEKEMIIKRERKKFVPFYFQLTKSVIKYMFKSRFLLTREIPNTVGKASGYYFAFNEKKPAWLLTAEKIFGLKYY